MKVKILFIFSGGIALVINLLSRFLINSIVTFRVAVLISYLLGMITGYTLFKKFVFINSNNNIKSEIRNFVLVNSIGLIQTWLIAVFLSETVFPNMTWIPFPNEIAHLIALSSVIFTSFLGHKYFTFKSHCNA